MKGNRCTGSNNNLITKSMKQLTVDLRSGVDVLNMDLRSRSKVQR